MSYRGGNRRQDDDRDQWSVQNSSTNKIREDRPKPFTPKCSEDGECLMFIDVKDYGRLIGAGGSQIRALEEETGTKINARKHESHDRAMVSIYGKRTVHMQTIQKIREVLGYQPLEENTNSAHINWREAEKLCDEHAEAKWAKFPPIVKYFYKEDPAVANMSEQYVTEFRKNNNNIEVRHVFEDENSTSKIKVPNPVETFEQAFKDYPDILREIRKQGFQKPSPIQCQAWPILLSGHDLIGIAQTGTGKTLAFLLPALIHIDGQVTPQAQSKRKGPNVLVLAPTRELALQIEKEVGKYSYHGIKAVCVYGGGNRKEQINTVTDGVEIVIATPGRLNDLIMAGILDISYVTFLILDEADRMLDLGFEPQIRKALFGIRPTRQTVMTSATWPQGVRRLAQSYMKNPLQVFIGSLDLTAVHTVTQTICLIDEEEKMDMMFDFLRGMGPDDKVIVFFARKAAVEHVSALLALSYINCQSIHGNREQCDREQALEDMQTGAVKILLATDVASRGLDIEDITHVLNYDFPRDIEEYVHRVGRTGRAGRTGESITYMTRKNWSHAKELIRILEEAQQEVPEEVYKMAERYEAWKNKKEQEGRRGGRGGFSGSRSRYRNW